MKIKFFTFLISAVLTSSVYGAGTETFSRVKELDLAKSYLDISKIGISTEIENNNGTMQDKVKLCLVIDGKYRITDEKEIILLLLEMIIDINTKLNVK